MTKTVTGDIERVDRKETLRYLGLIGVPPPETAAVLDECEAEVIKACRLTACYDTYDVRRDGDVLDLGFMRIVSRDLSRNLDGCDRTVLFAATAGVGIDRLINKYERVSPVRSAIVQAMGSAAVESWCDTLCDILRGRYGETRPRFSCGFGDVPLTVQRDIFRALDVTKSIGIALSDGCFMTPTKSVTAFLGIKRNTI